MKYKYYGLTICYLLTLTFICRGQTDLNRIVNIDGQIFRLEIVNNPGRPDNEHNTFDLFIKNIKTGKILFSKGFREYQYNLFKIKSDSLNEKGRLFLEVTFQSGGSGFHGRCLEISMRNNKINTYPVYNFDELSMLYFKSDNEIIKLEGIWNFRENESHFSRHRYEITRYNYINGKFRQSTIGKTRSKYGSLDDDESPKQLLTKIKKKEPLLARSISVN